MNGVVLHSTDDFSSRDRDEGRAWLVVDACDWHVLLPHPPATRPAVAHARPVTDCHEPDGWRGLNQADHPVARHGERSTEAWLKAGLRAVGIKTSELERLKGSDPWKPRLADHLWRRTMVSQKWLAEKLAMKSAANVSQQLRRLDGKSAIKKVPEEMKLFLEEADAASS